MIFFSVHSIKKNIFTSTPVLKRYSDLDPIVDFYYRLIFHLHHAGKLFSIYINIPIERDIYALLNLIPEAF